MTNQNSRCTIKVGIKYIVVHILIVNDANDCIIALICIQLFFCCYCSAVLNTGPDCGQFQQNTAEKEQLSLDNCSFLYLSFKERYTVLTKPFTRHIHYQILQHSQYFLPQCNMCWRHICPGHCPSRIYIVAVKNLRPTL